MCGLWGWTTAEHFVWALALFSAGLVLEERRLLLQRTKALGSLMKGLRSLLVHQTRLTKQHVDELSAKESETQGLNFP